MSTFGKNLNLRPQEKRVIVVIAVIIFIILNIVLVFPRFRDYSIDKDQLWKTRGAIATNNAYIAKDIAPGGFTEELARLEEQKGGAIAFKEIQLQETVTALARSSGVFIQTISPASSAVIGPGSQADKFFESQSVRVNVQSAEDSLVKFLYDLGNDPAMIRVRELELRPLDNNRYRLNATFTLTAEYQKTLQAKPVLTAAEASPKKAGQPPAPATAKPAARVATNTANPPSPNRGTPTIPLPPVPGQRSTPPSPNRANQPLTPVKPMPPTQGRPIMRPAPEPATKPPVPALPALPAMSALPSMPARSNQPPTPAIPDRPTR
jgi:hypothetical protein